MAQGWIYNATTGQTIGPIDWGEHPALCTTQYGDRVCEVQFWSHKVQRWVWVVARKTGRQLPAGVIEVEADDVYRIQRELSQGTPESEAFRKVLGVDLAVPA